MEHKYKDFERQILNQSKKLSIVCGIMFCLFSTVFILSIIQSVPTTSLLSGIMCVALFYCSINRAMGYLSLKKVLDEYYSKYDA